MFGQAIEGALHRFLVSTDDHATLAIPAQARLGCRKQAREGALWVLQVGESTVLVGDFCLRF